VYKHRVTYAGTIRFEAIVGVMLRTNQRRVTSTGAFIWLLATSVFETRIKLVSAARIEKIEISIWRSAETLSADSGF
jgi:hypothetical protein